MSNTIIRVQELGKLYKIGVRETAPKTLSSFLAKSITSPLRHLQKAWRKPSPEEIIWALKDISFEIKRGDVVGVIGRNGAGKSTLLKILSRITKPTEGAVELYGRVGSLLEVGTGFHPEFTGRENIYLNGNILGMKRREISRKFDEIVAFAEIEKFIDTPVKRYSSGMYVRLAFAVAAHLEPEILVIDEVLAVGDIAFQKKCLGKIETVAQQEGRTVLFVSHNIGAINQLCKSCLYLKNGKIQDIGLAPGIVRQYIEDALEFEKSHKTQDLDATQKLNIVDVYITDEFNKKVFVINFSNSFYVTIHYQLNQSISNLQFYIRVVNSDGISVVFSSDKDYSYSLDKEETLTEPGFYQIRVLVPGHFLFPDRYSIDVGAETYRVEVYDQQDYCLSFQVVSAGELNAEEAGWGLVYPQFNWSTEKILKPQLNVDF